MSTKIYQTIGTVTKEEKISSVESETFSNVLLLESQLPFPGYHGLTVPDKLEPDSIFAITKLMYNDERIIRCIQSVKKQLSMNFDAAPGSLHLQNKDVNFIRFKGLQYHFFGDVISHFEKCGIEFKKKRMVSPYTALIRVRKFFKMKEVLDGIYADMDNQKFAYLNIPVQMRWNRFKRITMDIRYNVEDKHYDAAQTSIYTETGLMDFVRIYDKEFCQGKLIFIREKYLEAISKH
ncbi:MAG: hypothetical protein KQH67_06565 [Bacteroidetes bacterium]|nr:hypothetical protein [Bacteroidota bacterium]